MLLLLVSLFVSLATSQYSNGQYGPQLSDSEPGYLPDYQGDQNANQQRMKETQELNKPFFDTIGGPPPAPSPAPTRSGPVLTSSAYPQQSSVSTVNANVPSNQYLNSPQASSSQSTGDEPGYLPDYQGDRYTNEQRINDTQALNKPFFDTIGGAPPAPPPTLAQSGSSASSGSANPYQSPQSTMNTNVISRPSNQYPSYPSYPGASASQSTGSEPGYLPDYQGDRYTNEQRIKDTQALNKAFFDTIGGAPPAPPPTLAQSGSAPSGSAYPYQSPLSRMSSYASNQLRFTQPNQRVSNKYEAPSAQASNPIQTSLGICCFL